MEPTTVRKEKRLLLSWQRLVVDNGRTCPRCQETGDGVRQVAERLREALAGLGVVVELEEKVLDQPLFLNDPLSSNQIRLNGRPLEEWLGASVGSSQCCDVCGDAQCRTVQLAGAVFEAIPEDLIIRAALLAAAELFT